MFLKSSQISPKSTRVGVFFNKVAGPLNWNFVKKWLQHRCFPVKFVKFLRTAFLKEHLQWLLLTVSGFQPATLIKGILRQRCFSVNFSKFLRTSFDRTPLDDRPCVYLRILRSFSDHFFYRAPLGNCLFHICKLQNFNHQIQSKPFHRWFLSILYKNEK